jgi:N-acetylneuraminic acid mutarotase
MLLILSACSDDQGLSFGSWTSRKDHPGTVRLNAIAFSLSGKGYWGMGMDMTSSHLRDIWSYDPKSDSWTQMKDFPFDLPAEASVTIGNKAYVMTFSGNLYEYNPDTDSWRFLSDSPVGNRAGMTAFALGGKAYFGTGSNRDSVYFAVYKDFWEYDPSLNTWVKISDFPGAARTDAISFVIGNKAYAGLGSNGLFAPPIFSDFWSFDSETGSWSQIQNFPEANSLIGLSFSNNLNAYISFPGNSGLHAITYEYTATSDSWRRVKSFPSGNSLSTSSFVINDRAYVIGGWGMEYSPQVWEFVP